MLVELRLSGSNRLLARLEMEEFSTLPHPGLWMDWGSESLLVVQRRHRYKLKQGSYQLAAIALEVKPQPRPVDAEWWNGQWVIGNPNCRFNARSPLLRCAVLPEGPCILCGHYQQR